VLLDFLEHAPPADVRADVKAARAGARRGVCALHCLRGVLPDDAPHLPGGDAPPARGPRQSL